MSASRGGSSRPSETASAKTKISSAPCLCAISAARRTSSTMPKKFGDWMITAAVSSSILLSRSARSSAPASRDVAELRHRHALMLRVGEQHFAIFRMHGARDQNAVAAGDPHGHHGGFRHGGGAVVHGSVGHFHAGQLADHGLEFEDGGERALRDFGLVGRVGSQKFAARDHRIHQHRPVMMVDARAQERRVTIGVFVAARAEVIDDFVFRFSGCDVRAADSAGLPAGRCENRSSRDVAPMADSISRRSRSDFGK